MVGLLEAALVRSGLDMRVAVLVSTFFSYGSNVDI